MDGDSKAFSRCAEALHAAQNVLFITGAGLSADSGVPTYRGIGGLYNDQSTSDGIRIEEALSGGMFRQNPALTWKYIAQIETGCRNAGPNLGHQVIAQFEQRYHRVTVLTQNVDGFHRRAGSKQVIDIHGDIHDLICTECPAQRTVPSYAGLSIPPICSDCGAVVRPNVVLFGEMLPGDKLQMLGRELRAGFDVIFSIGTTSVFPYIAEPVLHAGKGATTVEINPGNTEVTSAVDIKISQRAALALGEIARFLGWTRSLRINE